MGAPVRWRGSTWTAKGTNIYDIEEGCNHALAAHQGIDCLPDLHPGPEHGDVKCVPLEQLKIPVDGLCSGPPCPPWAGNGNKAAETDSRAQVLMTILTWVKHLIAHGGLIFTVLENVVGIQQRIGGQEPFM